MATMLTSSRKLLPTLYRACTSWEISFCMTSASLSVAHPRKHLQSLSSKRAHKRRAPFMGKGKAVLTRRIPGPILSMIRRRACAR